MRRGVNGEADFETDWSSFQSLKERKTKRIWCLEVWDYKRGKKSDLKGLLLFLRGGTLWNRRREIYKRFLEGFFLWVVWGSGVKRSSDFWGSWIHLEKLCKLKEHLSKAGSSQNFCLHSVPLSDRSRMLNSLLIGVDKKGQKLLCWNWFFVCLPWSSFSWFHWSRLISFMLKIYFESFSHFINTLPCFG